ncbi:predicted protein [Chaetomium globosum CBS 148.51]|uniref:Uncharacterized protein n=1 Tax=Chaetomium globosum (strain ATCC 6205 / CBS 148.51 / DSM 1962 / NBRC 6347 / NRRL 1970) TaxID=306901 RepID=Q2GYQ1_CHAGB|nr:uncharacterized protein CHGG_06903 [Chaetomium globosum CBS 148.51]EAQ85650.1 predicted protein [Chaetomium globosum CBS 148.51]
MPSRIWLHVFDKNRCACGVNTAGPVPNWELAESGHSPVNPSFFESLLSVSASHFRNFPAQCLVRVPCQVEIVGPKLLFQVLPQHLKISSTQRLLRVGNARPGCNHPNLENNRTEISTKRANFGARSRALGRAGMRSDIRRRKTPRFCAVMHQRRRMHVSPAACSQPDAKTVGRASATHMRPAAPVIFKSSSERAEGHNARPNPAPATQGPFLRGPQCHSHPAAPHGTSQVNSRRHALTGLQIHPPSLASLAAAATSEPRPSPSPKFSSHPSHRLVPLRGDIPQLRKYLFKPFALDIHHDWPSMLASMDQVTGGPQAGSGGSLAFPSPAPSTTRPRRGARVPPLWHARLTGQEQA